MISAMLLALAAGLTIPAGAFLASREHFAKRSRERELDGFVMDFGGGALLAAVALVLVPHGMEDTTVLVASLSFAAGGVVAWRLSIALGQRSGAASQFLGMLLDYVPESVALGASAAIGSGTAYLLAGLIALQNLPEGFASFEEMRTSGVSAARRRLLFGTAPLAGPLAALLGHHLLSGTPQVLAAIMLFCSGGIVYLVFEDIAPRARVPRVRFTAIGAVLGFLLGMVGTMLVGSG